MKKKTLDSLGIRRAAMDLLARREHGVQELARKLQQRGADPEQVQVELQRLQEEGLLCEQRYLASYIRSRGLSGRGPLRIREELQQRGLSRQDIDLALDEADIDWQEQLQEQWQRKFGEKPADQKAFAKQARFLLYRGYPMDWVQKLLR